MLGTLPYAELLFSSINLDIGRILNRKYTDFSTNSK